jgi:hypothetical protein
MAFRTPDEAQPAATAFGVWYREDPTPTPGHPSARHPVVDGMLESVESLAIERALALLDLAGPADPPRAHAAAPHSRSALSASNPAPFGVAARPLARVVAPAVAPVVAVRAREAQWADPTHVAAPEPYELTEPPLVRDVLALITRAEVAGVRTARAARWRGRVLDPQTRPGPRRLAALERRLRRWVAERADHRCPGSVFQQ